MKFFIQHSMDDIVFHEKYFCRDIDVVADFH